MQDSEPGGSSVRDERLARTERALIDAIPGCFFVYDRDFTLVDWNQTFLNIVGISEDECPGRRASIDVAPEDMPAAERAMAELATVGHTTVRARLVNAKTGKRTPVYFSSTTVPDGDGFRIVGLGIDISGVVETEHALHTEKAFFQSLLDSSLDGYVILNENRVITAYNQKFLGASLPHASLIGHEITYDRISQMSQRSTEPRHFYRELRHMLEHPLERGSFVFETVSGNILECSSAPVLDDNGARIGQIISYRDVTASREAEQRYRYLASHDSLSGLLNRSALFAYMDRLIAGGDPFSVIVLDIERFQRFNYTFGHVFGDRMLNAIGEKIRNATSTSHTVGRHGGDEFLVVVPGASDDAALLELADSIFAELHTLTSLDGRDIVIRARAGIAKFPVDGITVQELMTNADSAMSFEATPGRSSTTVFTAEMGRAVLERLSLEDEMRRAIAACEFSLVYQPKVDLTNGAITGVEALVRWPHPERGVISPEHFIPLAEETRLILPLGEWVLTTACRQAKHWADAGHGPIPVAVNVSLIQIYESDFLGIVRRVLAETELDPSLLELELTETVLAQDPTRIREVLTELSDLGVTVSIDDFGTGYSSLGYLKDFRVDRLKIDRSFTQQIRCSPEDDAIVQTAISIATTLGLMTIAEGIETVEQLEFLRSNGCLRGQGYLFSRPVPAESIEQMFRCETPGRLTW